MDKGFETTFSCDVMVRPKKAGRSGHEVAFGRVLIDGVWRPAYCPQSVVRRMQPQKGVTYSALAVNNPRVGATSEFMICRIEGPTQPALSDKAQSDTIGFLQEVGVSDAAEITRHLCAAHDVTESDVWITLQQMWREGSVSRVVLTRDASTPDEETLWASRQFKLSEILDG